MSGNPGARVPAPATTPAPTKSQETGWSPSSWRDKEPVFRGFSSDVQQ